MFKVGYSKSAQTTPAFAMIAEGWNALVQDGFTPEGQGSAPVGYDTEVLYAQDEADGEVVGVLCYSRQVATNTVFVALGYVEETSRNLGIYRLLWDALVARCRAEKIDRISGSVHVGNAAMHAVMRKLNRPAASVTYETILG